MEFMFQYILHDLQYTEGTISRSPHKTTRWFHSLDVIHAGIDFVWLYTTITILYLGFDSRRRLIAANKSATISYSMIVIGSIFFVLVAFHIHEDILGAPLTPAIHLAPLVVLAYSFYEYRRLVHEARG